MIYNTIFVLYKTIYKTILIINSDELYNYFLQNMSNPCTTQLTDISISNQDYQDIINWLDQGIDSYVVVNVGGVGMLTSSYLLTYQGMLYIFMASSWSNQTMPITRSYLDMLRSNYVEPRSTPESRFYPIVCNDEYLNSVRCQLFSSTPELKRTFCDPQSQPIKCVKKCRHI